MLAIKQGGICCAVDIYLAGLAGCKIVESWVF